METHSPTISRSQNQPSLPNQPFFSWLRTHTTLFIGQIVGLLSVVSVPIALTYYSIHADLPLNISWETVGHLVVYAHLFFLVVFIAMLIRMLHKNDIGRYRAKLVHEKLKGKKEDRKDLETYSTEQVARFKHRFLAFWCAMLLLYLIFAVEPLFSVEAEDCLQVLSRTEMFRTELFPILSFVLNNLSLIFIFCCFSVLYIPIDATPDRPKAKVSPADKSKTPVSPSTVNSEAPVSPPAKDSTPPNAKPNRTRWSYTHLMRSIVERLSDPDIGELRLRQRTLVVSFVVAIIVLTATFPLIMLYKTGVKTNWSEYPAVFDALSGTISAVVLALLVARLDSKLIGLPSWLICILYFYAGVQPMFVVFELHPEVYAGIKAAVLLVVFIFKIYFFLIIVYSLQTGRMFNYFFCSRILNQHVKTLREAQRKARQDSPLETAPETPPATTVDGKLTEPSLELPPQPSSRKTEESQPVDPEKEGWRAAWLKVLGLLAIAFFGGSLLFYVSLSEDHKESIDGSGLSKWVVGLHVALLLAILTVIGVLVFFGRRREAKSVSLPSDELRFTAPSKLTFKLSEPMPTKKRKLRTKELSDSTKSQFKSFTTYFRLFWISLLVLYVAMWFSVPDKPIPVLQPCPVKADQLQPTSEGKAAVSIGSVPAAKEDLPFTSIAEGKAAFYEYNHDGAQADETSPIGKIKNSEPQVEQLLSVYTMMRETMYPFIFFVVNNVTVMVLFWCFTVLYIPNDDEKFGDRHRLLRNYSLLLCVLLTVLVPLLAIVIKSNGFTQSEVEKLPTILGAVGGTLNAVAFALLIARLDSRIIRLRSLLISVLYVYAALQPLFVTFNQPSNLLKFIATSAMIAAFIFKICLVLMVGVVRNSGGLIDYLWFFPVLHNSVNSVFGNQFEIKAYSPKAGLFTFSVFHKNVEMYKAAEMWDIRAKCDNEIKLMVKAMGKRESYGKAPEKFQGTHWIQVKSGDHLICESIGLGSQSEVDELINESIAKVPYCKYDRG